MLKSRMRRLGQCHGQSRRQPGCCNKSPACKKILRVFSSRNPADKAPVAQSCMYQHWRLDMATTAARVADDNSIHRVLRDNGLSLVLFGLFAVSLVGQALTGHRHYNDEQIEHGQPTVSITEYLRSGEFLEATAENWESE